MISNKKKAFSIAEVIIAVVILGILGTIAFLAYNGYGKSARDTARLSAVDNITIAIDLFKNQRGKYPVPTDPVDVSYSGAVVWTQGGFGHDTARQTGKIFGDITDPLEGNYYAYSVTSSRGEYQLSYVLEGEEDNILGLNDIDPDFDIIPKAYASGDFTPDELNPIIWLDADDIDGDDDNTDNPSDASTITTWVNKGTLGASGNPTVTDGSIQYAEEGYDDVSGTGERAVFIDKNDGLLLNNSDITTGDIFYVVQNYDPFGGTDANGRGLQGVTSSNRYIGYNGKYTEALRIGGSPNHGSSSPATKNGRDLPKIFSFHTDNSNYEFYETGWLISQGATNSITGLEWAFNQAGNNTSKTADFVVSEILIFDSSLTNDEREKVEGYLAHKWGEESYLPTDHTYYSSPPDSSNPPTPDTTPDAFTLSDVTDATLSTEYTSNTITVSGINAATAISVTGDGTYNVNGGSYTSSAGSVNDGDTVTVRQTSSSSNSTAVNTTLTIGGVSDTYTVTTLVADTTPDTFTLSDVTDADVSTQYTSNSITVSGINTSVGISISGGGAEYRVGTGTPVDVSEGGSASASSTYSSNTPAGGFDNDTGTSGWGNNNVLPAWLEYDLGSGNDTVVTKYTLYRSSVQSGGWSNNNYSPEDWTFQGSDNGSSWTTLDTQTGESINSDSTKKEYSFSNTQAYRYYRIYITSAVHPVWTWVNITEMELFNDGAGTYTSTSGTVNNGEVVSVRMTSSSSPGTTQTGTLTIGTASEDYTITTIPADTTPDSFSFTDVEDATLSTEYTSNSITVAGINTAASISVTGGGTYSINGGSYTSSAGTVDDGDTVTIRQISSASNSTTVSTTLNIGGVDAAYNVTTPAPPPDSTPDSFSFTDVTDAALSTVYTSDTITVSGTNTGATISISGAGTYNINGGSYTSSAGSVDSGDIISVRNTSSSSAGIQVDATLDIGGVSDTYSITTIPVDTTPDAFTLSDVTDATLSTEYTSNSITVAGINTAASISVTGGGTYSVNGGSYTSSAGTVNNGDTIMVRQTSSSSSNTGVDTTLNIGGVSDTYSVTTLTADTTPDAFVFNDITGASLESIYTSDSITITGINTATSISITGSGTYSINGGSYTSSVGTINNGNTVTVRLTSAASKSSSVNTTLTIGGISDIYTVTTTLAETPSTPEATRAGSSIYVKGDYNGLFAHGVSDTNNNHFVFATPSIIASDLSNTDFINIADNKKLVYDGYDNYPASYTEVDSTFTSTGGFDIVRLSGPVIFTGTRDELASYTGLKEIDNAVRASYQNSEIYHNVSLYLDNYGTSYVENILSESVGINPIKPYYCSDILDQRFTYNVAPDATITATSNTVWGGVSGTGGIANGINSVVDSFDHEYHSDTPLANIQFEWDTPQEIGFVRIYNRTECCSSRLGGAIISLYDNTDALLYSHTLWDTTNDYVVDLDLEGIEQMYENVAKLTIESQGSDSYINLREVEIYVGGNIADGYYFVDSDGAGGRKPYQVYCDMTTDGGGWTKVGDNHVLNGDFSDASHALDYPSSTANWNRENNIIVQENPSSSDYAMRQQAVYGASTEIDYDIIFDDVSDFQVDSEIRLSARVADAWDEGDSTNGGLGYIFQNRLTYTDTTYVEHGERETLDTQTVGGKEWKLQMVRIPITKEVSSFVWNVGHGTEVESTRDFLFADLKAEIYYK